jgi:putative oxidoreductase
MLKSSNLYMSSTHNLLLLAGRMLLAWIFLHEGIDLVIGFNVAAAGMAKLGVPMPALVATITLQIAAGLAIALGYYARVGAAALGFFCLATAILFHNNFDVRNELLHFEKDIAIAGGMFILLVHGSGRWSIDKIWQRNRSSLSN